MKTGEIIKKNKLYKINHKGISLIVLVITIIVIIILAAAVIITLNNNNPISEANKARYESDRANMQSIFTNTVAKVMAQNQGSIKMQAGRINTVTSGSSSTTGEVTYILENSNNTSNLNGKIIFDNKENNENEYYTGKKLPIYKSRETVWSVDEEGILTLSVGGNVFDENKDNNTAKQDEVVITKIEYDNLINRIEKLENQPKSIEREELMGINIDIPLTTTWTNKPFTDVILRDSVENYKYLEFDTEVVLKDGPCYEKTDIFATNQLSYNNSDEDNWYNSSIFVLFTSSADAIWQIGGWFKNNKTLHIGSAIKINGDENVKYYRIKAIYGIK